MYTSSQKKYRDIESKESFSDFLKKTKKFNIKDYAKEPKIRSNFIHEYLTQESLKSKKFDINEYVSKNPPFDIRKISKEPSFTRYLEKPEKGVNKNVREIFSQYLFSTSKTDVEIAVDSYFHFSKFPSFMKFSKLSIKPLLFYTGIVIASSLAVTMLNVYLIGGSWWLFLLMLKEIGINILPSVFISLASMAGMAVANMSIDKFIKLAEKNSRLKKILQKKISGRFLSKILRKFGINTSSTSFDTSTKNVIRHIISEGIGLGISGIPSYFITKGINTAQHIPLRKFSKKIRDVSSTFIDSIISKNPENVLSTTIRIENEINNEIPTTTELLSEISSSEEQPNIEILSSVNESIQDNKILITSAVTATVLVGLSFGTDIESFVGITSTYLKHIPESVFSILKGLSFVTENSIARKTLFSFLVNQIGLEKLSEYFEYELNGLRLNTRNKVKFFNMIFGGDIYTETQLLLMSIDELEEVANRKNIILQSGDSREKYIKKIMKEQNRIFKKLIYIISRAISNAMAVSTAESLYQNMPSLELIQGFQIRVQSQIEASNKSVEERKQKVEEMKRKRDILRQGIEERKKSIIESEKAKEELRIQKQKNIEEFRKKQELLRSRVTGRSEEEELAEALKKLSVKQSFREKQLENRLKAGIIAKKEAQKIKFEIKDEALKEKKIFQEEKKIRDQIKQKEKLDRQERIKIKSEERIRVRNLQKALLYNKIMEDGAKRLLNINNPTMVLQDPETGQQHIVKRHFTPSQIKKLEDIKFKPPLSKKVGEIVNEWGPEIAGMNIKERVKDIFVEYVPFVAQISDIIKTTNDGVEFFKNGKEIYDMFNLFNSMLSGEDIKEGFADLPLDFEDENVISFLEFFGVENVKTYGDLLNFEAPNIEDAVDWLFGLVTEEQPDLYKVEEMSLAQLFSGVLIDTELNSWDNERMYYELAKRYLGQYEIEISGAETLFVYFGQKLFGRFEKFYENQ